MIYICSMELQELEIYRSYRDRLGIKACDRGAPVPVLLFEEIAGSFKTLFLDGFGTLYNLTEIHRKAPVVLNHLREQGCTLRLITNAASRSPLHLKAHLDSIGIHFELEEIISSGSLLEFAMNRIQIHSAFHLGRSEADGYLLSAGIRIAEHPAEPVVVISSGVPGKNDRINHARDILRAPGSMLVVLNPDAWAPKTDGTRIPVSGSLAWQLQQETSCQIEFFGKPFRDIYQRALATVHENPGEVLMIGDTLGTDILGGRASGIKTALVLGGNSTWDSVHQDEADLGIYPDFYLESLL